ncbi:unnamed protein product [Alopecurus aequalis]
MRSQENEGQGRGAIEMVARQPPLRARNESPPPRRPIIFSPERRTHNRPVVFCVTLACIILWGAIVCAALAVLIVYLAYHPKLPVFSVDTASLNAGNVDELTVSGGPSSGGLALNADLSVLAVITSNNSQIDVELHDMQLDLYFRGHMIGTQVLNPPARERPGEHVPQSVHFVTSEIPLPQEDAEAWRNATANGGPVVLHLAGRFRARLIIGPLLRFPMKVYPHCTLWLKPPPRGILLESRCRQ